VSHSVALAMSYLHSQTPAIVHKDLKSHNILVDDNWTIKVADYGLSSVFNHINNNQYWAGAAQWRAPEVSEHSYGLSADVYSYGVVIWEMITRKRPFEGLTPAEALRAVKGNAR
jgi:serine/threonine protein kinase